MRALLVVVLMLSALPASGARLISVGGDPRALVANPVTGELVILHRNAFANRVTVLDPATDLVRNVDLPLAIEPGFFNSGSQPTEVDVLRNRLYARLADGTLVAIELRTLGVYTFPMPIAYLALDPGNDTLYATPPLVYVSSPYEAPPTLYAIDGETLQVEALDIAPLTDGFAPAFVRIHGVTVDPRAGRAQVFVHGPNDLCMDAAMQILEVAGSPPQVVNATPSMCARQGLSSASLSVDPFRRLVYYTDLANGSSRHAWGVNPGFSLNIPYGFDFAGRRRWFSHFSNPPFYSFRGYDEESQTVVFDQPWYGSVNAVNPASRRVYVWRRFYNEMGPDFAPPEVRVVDADTLAQQVFGPPGSFFAPSDVNVATNKVYGIGYLSEGGPTGIVEIDEPVSVPVPMPTTITPGTPSPDGNVTVDFSATSSWVPYDHDVLRIVYQVDSKSGRWLRGSSDGESMQVAITGLAPGTHTIYAMATDGLEGRVSPGHTIVTGPIASAQVTIPAPSLCSNGLDDDGDGLTDFPADPGCRYATSFAENPKCDDDLDNDGDGTIDWDGGSGAATPDSICVGKPWLNRENPASCGVGAELALLGALVTVLRRRRAQR